MTLASSSYDSLERTLDRTIECLTGSGQAPQTRALLIEARRLRSVVANWRSIPPPPDVHDEMLERVLMLSTAVGAALPQSSLAAPPRAGLASAPRKPGPAPAPPRAPERAPEPEPEPPPESEPPESEPPASEGYPEISTTEAMESAVEEDDDTYSLDFEPHLYSLETVTTMRRQAVPPPPPDVDEPAAHTDPGAVADDAPALSERPRPRNSPPPPSAPESALPDWALVALAPPIAPVPALDGAAGAARSPADHAGTPARPVTKTPAKSVPPPAPRPREDAVAPAPSPPPPVPAEAAPPLPPMGMPGPAAVEGDDDLAVPRTVVTAHAVALGEPVSPLLSVYHEPYGVQADAYRALRRKLVSSADPRVIGVTSAHPGEGKTVCALNLALTLRESARSPVLVVEANLRSPILAKLLGFSPPECFIVQLARHIDDPRAAWHAAELLPRLHVMAIDTSIKHEPLLNPVAFGAGMDRLKQAGYEYIIADTPPVLGGVDCNVIADSMDGMLFAALMLKAKRKEMRKAVEQLEPAPMLGVVVLEV